MSVWAVASHIKYMGLSIFLDAMQNIFYFLFLMQK
jgi:hypothetical protein